MTPAAIRNKSFSESKLGPESIPKCNKKSSPKLSKQPEQKRFSDKARKPARIRNILSPHPGFNLGSMLGPSMLPIQRPLFGLMKISGQFPRLVCK